MGRKDKNQPTETSAQDAANLAPDQVNEPANEGNDQSRAQGEKCPTCDGRGVRVEVSEHELCPDCNGSGTLESEQ